MQPGLFKKEFEYISLLKILSSLLYIMPKGKKLKVVDIQNETVIETVEQPTETATEHHGFQYDNMLFSRIKHIQKDEYHGTLYDLQMEHIHDYMIHNGVIHNGGGKRNGSFAIYLEPWHADLEMFLQMRKNHGDEELKARDLFYALWVPDLFMERVKANQSWTLMCPH